MPTNKKVTITDVAKKANVSVATVSRILNNRDGKIKISQKTTDRVLTVANELGYQLNPFAASLRTKRTGVIGAIVRDISDPFLVKVVKAVQHYAHHNGVELFLANTDYKSETAHQQLKLMVNHWFDGLIILDNLSEEDAFIQRLKHQQTPFVSITGESSCSLKPVVHTDDVNGVQQAIDHFIQLGHEHIGYIGNALPGVQMRYDYFCKYMKKRNLQVNSLYVQPEVTGREDIAEFMEGILACKQPPTAIFCATDALALKLVNVAGQYNVSIPNELSIIGFDNIDEAADYYPALTTVSQSSDQLASQAVDLLMEIINTEQPIKKEIVIPPELVVRESTSVPKG
ncbi:LacI family DNA-binding transcriptional regulator [Pontibacillus litoralis]|uniref:LacI family transcriptional regulator n=1 Tax=Pontibacillus litoralis JSM 072002 TaxID=1385512 RepID=A0A0A5FYB4_9BACI|nr:LacI family DNA-binding transcriptional regulator [Pontibacillus litoralis]KGX84784.1 LacI family transcriptional regulator [Pontibacillus litoralis JSM 072002]